MATKVLWYSVKEDDASKFRETLKKADEYCAKNDLPFNQLVNGALRKFLNLSAIKIEGRKKGAKKKGGKKQKVKKAEKKPDADADAEK